eukprot:912141_1
MSLFIYISMVTISSLFWMNKCDNTCTESVQIDQDIANIDFSDVFRKLADNSYIAKTWTRDVMFAKIEEYRKFLHLSKKYPATPLVPSVGVDEVWHYHILDTRQYVKDCNSMFGHFLHHYPYYGMNGIEDEANWNQSILETEGIYTNEFGQDPYDTQWYSFGIQNAADCNVGGGTKCSRCTYH